MSFKNMDKLIYPAGYFRLRYSLNCVETHGCIHRTEFNFRQRGFFFPLWAHKKLLPSNSLGETTLWCSILCFYVTLFSILSLFFSLFPWFSPLPLPYIHSLFLICLFPVHLLFIFSCCAPLFSPFISSFILLFTLSCTPARHCRRHNSHCCLLLSIIPLCLSSSVISPLTT